MKNLNGLIEETLFDVGVEDVENCKEKMKNIIIELNDLLKNTPFKINSTEFNSDVQGEWAHIGLIYEVKE
jgi:hypothetical protein